MGKARLFSIMAKDSKKLTSASEPDNDTNKEGFTPIDLEDLDSNGGDEDLSLSLEDRLATKKMAARRKIEMYWEKKRLKEQLGDFEEFDLDF